MWVKINILLTSAQIWPFGRLKIGSSTYWYLMTCQVSWNSNHWFLSYGVYKWLDADARQGQNQNIHIYGYNKAYKGSFWACFCNKIGGLGVFVGIWPYSRVKKQDDSGQKGNVCRSALITILSWNFTQYRWENKAHHDMPNIYININYILTWNSRSTFGGWVRPPFNKVNNIRWIFCNYSHKKMWILLTSVIR